MLHDEPIFTKDEVGHVLLSFGKMWFFTAKRMELFSILCGNKQQKNYFGYFFCEISGILNNEQI